MDLTPGSDIYADLLDYGRPGDIAEWLREMGEAALAANVDAIDTGLSDHAFFAQLKSAIIGIPLPDNDSSSLSATFHRLSVLPPGNSPKFPEWDENRRFSCEVCGEYEQPRSPSSRHPL